MAIAFDGSNDGYVASGTAPVLSSTWSLACWFKPNSQADSYGVICTVNNGTGLYYRGSGAGGDAGKLDWFATTDHLSTTALANGVWHHLAVTSNGTTVTFYLNGVADGSGSWAAAWTPNRIGDDASSESLKGSLARLYLWDGVALSGAEVLTAKNGGEETLHTSSIKTGLALASAPSAGTPLPDYVGVDAPDPQWIANGTQEGTTATNGWLSTLGYRVAAFTGTAEDARTNYEHSGARQAFYTNGTWWMWAESDEANDHWLWKWDGTTPAEPGRAGGWAKAANSAGGSVLLDTRPGSRFDMIWEEAQQRLHCLAYNTSSSEYNIWTYNSGTDQWTNTLVDEAVGVNCGSDGSNVAIALDSARRLWLCYYDQSDKLLKSRFLDTTVAPASMAFSAGPTIDAVATVNLSFSGVDALAWSNAGAASIGVGYSHQDGVENGNGSFKFAFRADSAGTGDAWTVETIADPSDIDSHVSVCGGAVGGSGDTVFLFGKRESGSLVAYKRPPSSAWSSQAEVWPDADPWGSRPKITLDTTNNTLYAFAGIGGGGVNTIATVRYKTSATGSLSFGSETVVLRRDEGTNGDFTTPSLPCHNVTATTNLLVYAGGPTVLPEVDCTWWRVLDIVAANQAPSVNAGTDQTITLPATCQLDATVSDDGLPASPGTTTPTWSKLSGSGTVTFTPNANTVDAVASFSAADTYVLRLSVTDGELTTTDDVTITVNAAAAGATKNAKRLALLGA